MTANLVKEPLLKERFNKLGITAKSVGGGSSNMNEVLWVGGDLANADKTFYYRLFFFFFAWIKNHPLNDAASPGRKRSVTWFKCHA